MILNFYRKRCELFMFDFFSKDVYGKVAIYTFNVLNTNRDNLGKAVIIVGDERHDAGLIFKEEVNLMDVYDIIEDFRQLLDWDLIKIDEPHERIILAEITYR